MFLQKPISLSPLNYTAIFRDGLQNMFKYIKAYIREKQGIIGMKAVFLISVTQFEVKFLFQIKHVQSICIVFSTKIGKDEQNLCYRPPRLQKAKDTLFLSHLSFWSLITSLDHSKGWEIICRHLVFRNSRKGSIILHPPTYANSCLT